MAILQTTAKTVTTQQGQDFVNALCDIYGYQDNVPNPNYTEGSGLPTTIVNPQTRNQFAQTKFDEFAWTWGRNIVLDYRRRQLPAIDTNTGL